MFSTSGYAATREQVEELVTILSIMRPHQSKMESKFIHTFLRPFQPQSDAMGNLIVKVGDAPVLWSSHVDTVHQWGGLAPVQVDDKGIISVPDYSKANCLGADDGTGVWLMMQMIRAERPGLYVFHRGEERGGVGSKFIAAKTPKLLDGIECAIAFDRKGTGSIITHQWGGRCCSEDFSKSLAGAIGLDMKSDSTGSFTDTASYVDLVGECTNVSVGYTCQHGRSEDQDLLFALELHQRLLEVDVRDLTFKRKKGDKEKKSYTRTYYGGYGGDTDYYGDGQAYGTTRHWDSAKLRWANGKEWSKELQGYVYPGKVWDEPTQKWVDPDKTVRKYLDTRPDTQVCYKVKGEKGEDLLLPETMLRLVCEFPEELAAMLEDKKYGLSYLHEQIRSYGGVVETGYLTKPKGGSTICPTCTRFRDYCQCGES